jgi:hypothetical protein
VQEEAFDRGVMIDQQLDTLIDRSMRLADTDVSGASTTLPTPAASKLLGWSSDGLSLANYASASIADTIVPTAFMETLLDDGTAAQARTTLGAGVGDFLADGTVPMTGDLQIGATKAIVFEGTTADAFETTLAVADPTADRTITLPNSTGTVALTSDIVPAAGQVVQVVNTMYNAVVVGASTAMPYDDSIPQNTEGDEFMSRAITPTNASNKLKITVVFCGNENTNTSDQMVVALFQDSTAGALAAIATAVAATVVPAPLTFVHYMTAGTASATTFKVRAGLNTANPVVMNGSGSARILGGVCASSITIEEIKV